MSRNQTKHMKTIELIKLLLHADPSGQLEVGIYTEKGTNLEKLQSLPLAIHTDQLPPFNQNKPKWYDGMKRIVCI